MSDALDHCFTVRSNGSLDVKAFTFLASTFPGVGAIRNNGFEVVDTEPPYAELRDRALLRRLVRERIEGILFGRLKSGVDIGIISAQVMQVVDDVLSSAAPLSPETNYDRLQAWVGKIGWTLQSRALPRASAHNWAISIKSHIDSEVITEVGHTAEGVAAILVATLERMGVSL